MKKKNILWIGLGGALATAAAIFFMKKKNGLVAKPPRKAPQLKTENPGDQSEFTIAPSDSELG